jgi:hypothetical protein
MGTYKIEEGLRFTDGINTYEVTKVDYNANKVHLLKTSSIGKYNYRVGIEFIKDFIAKDIFVISPKKKKMFNKI